MDPSIPKNITFICYENRTCSVTRGLLLSGLGQCPEVTLLIALLGALVAFGIYCVLSYFLQNSSHVQATDAHVQTDRYEYTDGATQTEEPMSDETEEQSLNNTKSMSEMKVNDAGLPDHAFTSNNEVHSRHLQRSNSVNFPIEKSQYSQLADLFNKFDFSLRYERSPSTSNTNRSSSVLPQSTEEEYSDILNEESHHSHSSTSTTVRVPGDKHAEGTYVSLQGELDPTLQVNQNVSPTHHGSQPGERHHKVFASNMELNRIEKPAPILPRKLGRPPRSKSKRSFFKRTAFDHSKSSSVSTLENSINISNDEDNSENRNALTSEEFVDDRFNKNHFQTFCKVFPRQDQNKLEEKVPVSPNRFTDGSHSTFEIPKCLSPSIHFNSSLTELSTIISFYSGEETVVGCTDHVSSAVDLNNLDKPDNQEREREIADYECIQTDREDGESIRDSNEKIREGSIKKQVNSIFRRMYKPFKVKYFERKNKTLTQ